MMSNSIKSANSNQTLQKFLPKTEFKKSQIILNVLRLGIAYMY